MKIRHLYSLTILVVGVLTLAPAMSRALEPVGTSVAEKQNLFLKENLTAWCIVPFDGKQRTPEERAEMLARLGIRHFAYDWRPEHIASFEREIIALKKHGIELSAFNSPNERAFELFEKYNIKPQIWASFQAAPAAVTDYEQRVEFAIQSILPLVERTRRMGCQLGLYAHGGWSGYPDNMVAVAKRLREEYGASHVGIVYNMHWAHNVLDRFPEVMAILKPYLIGMNINGMTRNGPAQGKMILPLGQGDLDITLLRQIRDSGYTGRIGILNHSNEDAELRLQDNLDGLAWILPQLDGSPAGPQPKPRSWMEPSQVSAQMFGRANLAAWCIVPYDGNRRGPEERAAMLERLGITKFVYDYRKEHIPQWDAELAALTKHHIDLLGWWFPNQLNDEGKAALELFKRHGVRPQLWVSGGGGPIAVKDEADQKARVAAEVTRLKPICAAAVEIGCTVGLYNHGNWFGEPENQLAIIEALKAEGVTNVGIVYNFHHGHGHLDRLVRILARTRPHLLCVNLNGMDIGGDEKGRKILPLGAGTEDLRILNLLRESGYRGPIGVLNHTSEDAEARLLDNLDGLNWLLPQLDRKAPGPKPAYRTKTSLAPYTAFINGGREVRRVALSGAAVGKCGISTLKSIMLRNLQQRADSRRRVLVEGVSNREILQETGSHSGEVAGGDVAKQQLNRLTQAVVLLDKLNASNNIQSIASVEPLDF